MPSLRRRLIPVAIVVAAAACAGSSTGGTALVPLRAPSAAAAAGPCGLSLPRPVRGELAFRIPSGGRAARRLLVGRLMLCTLFRKDGSRFARLYSDSHARVLGVAFYRPSGVLRSAVDTSYAVAPEEIGASVKCDSSSQASIGPAHWREPRHWWIGATAKGIDRDVVVDAVRNAQSEWTNNINWCGIKDEASPPAQYEGKTSGAVKHDGKSVIDWGSLENDQDCNGALACTGTWYDEQGNPVESDIRFNTAFKWSTEGASDAYDIQSVAAHEIGHVLQFDHVTNQSKRDYTELMWPYVDIGDTTGRKLGRGDALQDNSHY